MVRRHAIAASLAVVMTLVVSLSAHMKLQRSEPPADGTVKAPLETVQVWFNEAPDVTVSKLTLRGPSGEVKLAGMHAMENSLMATVERSAGPGKYTLAWQSAGDDGHVQKGELTFTVEAAQ